MLRRFLAGLIFLQCVTSAFAQNPVPNASATASPGVPKALVGDHWTYEVKDEISGAIKFTRTDMVTDISNNEIAVRVDFADPGRTSNIIYDRSWNILRSDPFKYSPNDGTGVQLALTTGSQWKFAIDVVNSRNGLTFRRVGNSRVTGQESITTKAGSFNTFVIETNYTGKNVQDFNPRQSDVDPHLVRPRHRSLGQTQHRDPAARPCRPEQHDRNDRLRPQKTIRRPTIEYCTIFRRQSRWASGADKGGAKACGSVLYDHGTTRHL